MDEKEFPPNMKLFAGAIRKNDMNQMKINQFKDWMNGKKFQPEWKEDAENLVSQAEALLKKAPPQTRTFNAPRPGFGQGGGRGGYGHGDRGSRIQTSGSNANAADPAVIGFPFHNPYTFIPFPKQKPERHAPTQLSIDEIETDRISGVVQVEIKTLSPLLTSQAFSGKNKPKHHPVLKIGNDVIVPASSVRGALRNLMSIVYGGTLSYVDEELWLCQGRDTPLGGYLKGVQDKLYLAQIVKPGDSFHDGEVKWGEAQLVKDSNLEYVLQRSGRNLNRERKDAADPKRQLWIDNPENPMYCSDHETQQCSWLVKISGRKVNQKGTPHEGAFQPSRGKTMFLPKSLWADYQGRNRNSVVKELRKGQVVWLESHHADKTIVDVGDVKSIQWARWGRSGSKLISVIPDGFRPDSMNTDGKVDIVSDLFGTVFMKEKELGADQITSFAARIVPENLVFKDSAGSVFSNNMPPLSSPHPGCVAFYLDNENYDTISIQDLPRGYKVYRNTTKTEQDHDAPWHYDTQPIYERNTPKKYSEAGEMVYSADLLPADKTGTLKLSFRALNNKELSLLLLALSCDLRFGGGKPVGLGHCISKKIKVTKEDGSTICEFEPERAKLPDGFALDDAVLKRAELYCKTQEPVDMIRYPRFTKENGDRGGMIWFAYFAVVKKGTGVGLQTTWTDGELREKAGKDQIKAQALPKFDPENPSADCLYGYDAQFEISQTTRDRRNLVSRIIPPDEVKVNPNAHRDDNNSQNRGSRQDDRRRR